MPSLERGIARRQVLTGSVAAIGASLAAGSRAPASAVTRSPRRTASLELDAARYVELDADFLDTQTTHYARIKRMRDGRFILFYQSSQQAWSIYWTTSRDLKSWAKPQVLFATHKILDGADDRCYSCADARVLDNGDILVVCSFRANLDFSTDMELDGLMLRRSADNGRTWQREQVIYVGANSDSSSTRPAAVKSRSTSPTARRSWRSRTRRARPGSRSSDLRTGAERGRPT